MTKKTFQAKDYDTREKLDMAVTSVVGTDIRANREVGHEIKGNDLELEILNIKDTGSVFGVKIVNTENPSKDKAKIKHTKVKRH